MGNGGREARGRPACGLLFPAHPECRNAVLYKFEAESGLPKFNTLWEGLALLIGFMLWLPVLSHGAVFRAKLDNGS